MDNVEETVRRAARMLAEFTDKATSDVCPDYVRDAVCREGDAQFADCDHGDSKNNVDCPYAPGRWKKQGDPDFHAMWSPQVAHLLVALLDDLAYGDDYGWVHPDAVKLARQILGEE